MGHHDHGTITVTLALSRQTAFRMQRSALPAETGAQPLKDGL